jgi:outer membrane protein OmpA-like peptidoglycan-associated protein
MNRLRSTSLAAALVLALGLAGCQTRPPTNADLEQARTAVQLATTQADAARAGQIDVQRAREALARAETAWKDRDDESTRHWSYLARQRAEVAQAVARQARDEERLKNASTERERVRLEARTREAEQAGRRASSAEQQAQAARQQAQSAQAQAQSAQAQARSAQSSAALAQQQSQQLRDQAAQSAERAAALERDLQALQARKTDRGMVVTLGDVLFQTGRAELAPGALRSAEQLAAVLQQYPERRVLVEGFTDSVGSEDFNRALSQRRAEAFANALRARGVEPARITVQGQGESWPVANNATPAGRQLNRRVEVLFSDPQGGFASR